jgi:FkbM family methyltransferase
MVKLYAARATRRRRLTLRVPGIARPVICRPSEPDRFTLCHVFFERDAEPPAAIQPRLIVDAGANVGYVSVYYANRFPGATILAMEPDTQNFEMARENCAPYPQIQLLRAALGPRDQGVNLVAPAAGRWASWGMQAREAATDDAQAVEALSIPTLLDRTGHDVIDILKLDIEGTEEALFTGTDCLRWLPRVGVILVETHGEASERAVLQSMREAGFKQIGDGHRLAFANSRLV